MNYEDLDLDASVVLNQYNALGYLKWAADNIRTAMLLWMMHMNYGHMPMELCELRKKLYKEMEEK